MGGFKIQNLPFKSHKGIGRRKSDEGCTALTSSPEVLTHNLSYMRSKGILMSLWYWPFNLTPTCFIFLWLYFSKAKLIQSSNQIDYSNPKRPSIVKEKVEQKDKRKAVPKLYPDSILFAKWGDGLSEEEQKEAQALFQKYGYNVFLSNLLPLNRELPDTRDERYVIICHVQYISRPDHSISFHSFHCIVVCIVWVVDSG